MPVKVIIENDQHRAEMSRLSNPASVEQIVELFDRIVRSMYPYEMYNHQITRSRNIALRSGENRGMAEQYPSPPTSPQDEHLLPPFDATVALYGNRVYSGRHTGLYGNVPRDGASAAVMATQRNTAIPGEGLSEEVDQLATGSTDNADF